VRKLVVLAVLVAVLLVGDFAARSAAESAIESGIQGRVSGVGSVDARIDSFPFTGRLLGQGKVANLDLRLSDVTGHGIDVAWLRLQASGLALDRSAMFGGKVELEGVDHVAVTAHITEAAISALAGAHVELLGAGQARVTYQDVTATARVTVADGRLQFTADGLPALSVPVPSSDLLPCAVDAVVVAGAVDASCTADHLPAIVASSVAAAT
jgi:hypothetical protein